MRPAFFLSILLSINLIVGCSTKRMIEKQYMGEWFQSAALRKIDKLGYHSFQYDHLKLSYYYRVNDSQTEINLRGTVEYIKPAEKSKFGGETFLLNFEAFVLICLFTDKNGTVIAVETADMPTGSSIMKPLPFDVTLPFSPKYKQIFVGYRFSAREGY